MNRILAIVIWLQAALALAGQLAIGGDHDTGLSTYRSHNLIVIDRNGVAHGTGLIHKAPAKGQVFRVDPKVDLPLNYDERGLGFVSPVRNQGSCGDCWAHAVVENLEDQILRAGHAPMSLSVEQMTDCDYNAYGCGGGSMDDGAYAVDPGLALESDYPWQGGGYRCKRFRFPPIAAKAAHMVYVGTQDSAPTTDDLQQALYQHGSLFVTVSAGGDDWDGRDTMRDCSNSGSNHMVELVGWKQDPKNPGKILWIMRNSWGADWGDKGFAYMPPQCDDIANEAGGAAYLVYE